MSDKICRCDIERHPHHQGKHCDAAATRDDGLCDECNNRIAADMDWRPGYQGPVPQGNPRSR